MVAIVAFICFSSIIAACDNNDVATLRLVLARNHPTQCQNISLEELNQGLVMSVVRGYKECVELLLESGADVNVINSDGDTLLMLAVRHDHVDLVQYLLTKPIHIERKNFDSRTALHLACISDNQIIAEMLLAAGADKTVKTYNSETPLTIAVSNNNLNIVKFLLKKGCEVNDKTHVDNYLIHIASTNDNCDMCRILVDAGAIVNCKNCFGFTPLHCAAINGNIKIMEVLLGAGADINSIGMGRETVLHRACAGKSLECVQFVLENEHFVGIDAVDVHGLTALGKAIHAKNDEIVKYLIQEGASAKCPYVRYLGMRVNNFILGAKAPCYIMAGCLAENRLETASLLFMSGQYTFQELRDQLKFLQQDQIKEISEWIKETFKPPPLKNICRAVINESIKLHIAIYSETSSQQSFVIAERRNNIESLQIPAAIKDYLMFSDL